MDKRACLQLIRNYIEEGQQHAENIPVYDNPTAANTYAAPQAFASALEGLAAVVEAAAE